VPTLILAALKEELAPIARVLDPGDFRLVCTGVGPERAAQATRQHATPGSVIVSTGCCGGLVPGASPGMLVVPRAVLHVATMVTEAPPPDVELRRLSRRLAEQLGLHCSARPLATVENALLTPRSKRECHHRCGAVVVDMETAAIAEVAAQLGLPYVSIRVVLDTVDESLPPMPGPMRDARGRLQPRRLLDAARRPRDLLTLASLAYRLRSASGGLGRCIAGLMRELG